MAIILLMSPSVLTLGANYMYVKLIVPVESLQATSC